MAVLLTWIENWLEKMNKILGVFNNEEYIKANKIKNLGFN
jgi:hypothetical protein